MPEFEPKYTLHKFEKVESCEADSLPDLEYEEWCGTDTLYYVTGAHLNIALCKGHREQLREKGLLK